VLRTPKPTAPKSKEKELTMTTVRRPLIAGNWKMNGLKADGLALVRDVLTRLEAVAAPGFDMLVCPPSTLIDAVAATVDGAPLLIGAQDCHAEAKGAHTGDIAAPMLADLGCSHVIVGHSERRTDHGESDAAVRGKAAAVQGAGMTAVICIGETEAQRDAGETEAVVRRQLAGSLPSGAGAANTVVAYEPVWAIGTGRTPTVDEVQAIHALIRAELIAPLGAAGAAATRILYGGSMKPENAAALLALPDVDGGLIGGASLKAVDFWAIAQCCR
jgi:triosephosphate isomerase